MKTDKRILREVFHCEVTTGEGTLKVGFQGRTTKDNELHFTVEMKWFLWVYLVREVAKAWLGVRQSRLNEIQRIDDSLPKQP